MSAPPLLPLRPAFLRRLAASRALAYPFFRGFHPYSALSGPPTEFDGHRPYLPGDDTRWIDWNLFARFEELYVKVFQVEEEVEILLMVDASDSMISSGGSKYHVAAAAATALAYLAMMTSHPVTVVRYAEGAVDSEGPCRQIQSLPGITKFLISEPKGGGTDLRKSTFPLLLGRRRPVTVVALSDGFQREPLERAVAAVRRYRGRRFVLVRIKDPRDLAPSLRGNLLVSDAESGDLRAVLSDRTLERQIHGRIAQHFENLEANLAQSGGEVHPLNVEEPFEEGLLAMLTVKLPTARKASAP